MLTASLNLSPPCNLVDGSFLRVRHPLMLPQEGPSDRHLALEDAGDYSLVAVCVSVFLYACPSSATPSGCAFAGTLFVSCQLHRVSIPCSRCLTGMAENSLWLH